MLLLFFGKIHDENVSTHSCAVEPPCRFLCLLLFLGKFSTSTISHNESSGQTNRRNIYKQVGSNDNTQAMIKVLALNNHIVLSKDTGNQQSPHTGNGEMFSIITEPPKIPPILIPKIVTMESYCSLKYVSRPRLFPSDLRLSRPDIVLVCHFKHTERI